MKKSKKKSVMNQEPDFIDSRKISATDHDRIANLIAAHKAKRKRAA